MKKTVPVSFLKEKANHFLANSPDDKAFERKGLIDFLQIVLIKNDSYLGFGYLDSHEVPNGCSVGIVRGEPNVFPDETRIKFY